MALLSPSRATILCIYVFVFVGTGNLCTTVVHATDIKWIGNTNSKGSAAAEAPRSQRYWDANGIKRPDYAKTDAELAAERGGASSSNVFWFGLLLLGGAVAYMEYVRRYVRIPDSGDSGYVLGGGGGGALPRIPFLSNARSSSAAAETNNDKIRQARLARLSPESAEKQE